MKKPKKYSTSEPHGLGINSRAFAKSGLGVFEPSASWWCGRAISMVALLWHVENAKNIIIYMHYTSKLVIIWGN